MNFHYGNMSKNIILERSQECFLPEDFPYGKMSKSKHFPRAAREKWRRGVRVRRWGALAAEATRFRPADLGGGPQAAAKLG